MESETNPMELIVMQLVVGSGNARSLAIEAIRAGREGDFSLAEEKLKECGKSLAEAHEIQTSLIQKEARGDHMQVQLLMVHAQDHLMNAMTVRDLAVEIIELSKKILS